jgi:phenylacetate-CoA ligase
MGAVFPEQLPRDELERLRCERLADLIRAILPANRFYARKFADAGLTPDEVCSPADLKRLPFTTKAELVADQADHPLYGSDLTYPLTRYCRMHQTSGTSGRPLRWLDTPESWAWALDCWAAKFRFVRLRSEDRLFFPFSFGPFLGFWTAFESAAKLGHLCLPGGAMGSTARLRFLLDNEATVVLCTPTYALRLAEVARKEGIDLRNSAVRTVIVAGEPGGSIPATRQRIESAWGTRVFDHHGMTETGPVTAECVENPGGIHVLEHHYIAEVIDPATGRDVQAGTVGELVLTNLGRWGSPVLRYRTGDLVRVDPKPCPCGCPFVRLDGGIRGRADDMIVLRGNNVHPGALQAILHRFEEILEYRLEVDRSGTLPVLRVEIEVSEDADTAARVDRTIRDELLFRADVRLVEAGTLPRFEMKAQRLVKK